MDHPMSNAERQRRYRRRQHREVRELRKDLDRGQDALDRQERKHRTDLRLLERTLRRLRRAYVDARAMREFVALVDRWPELPDDIKRQLAGAKDAKSLEALLRSETEKREE
jgi:hypothetical protein